MLTIYFWKPRLQGTARGATPGHVALQAGTAYISFYPKSSDEVLGEGGFRLISSYEEEANPADEVLNIRSLPHTVVEQRWNSEREALRNYHVTQCNCSTVVVEFLFMAWEEFLRTASLFQKAKLGIRFYLPWTWPTALRAIRAEFFANFVTYTPLGALNEARRLKAWID